MKIADRLIGTAHKPFIIGELSANHNQCIDRALEIIDAAAEAGVDAIKLQTYTADTMTIEMSGGAFSITDKASLWYGRTLYDLYEEAMTPWDWHQSLFDRCHEKGLICFSTPFDDSAVDFLETLNVPAYKVASFEITHLPLLRKIGSTGKPIIMSTGMANEVEIEEAVSTLRSAGSGEICLLHCVSGYPAPAADYNLRTLTDMAERFGTVVGLSDHSLTNITSVTSIAFGAAVIEKHITLRREDGGPDGTFSVEPDELKQLCSDCYTAWTAIGEVDYACKKSEEGNLQFRRSLYAVEDIAAGDKLTDKNIRVIRPGFGLLPKAFDEVVGKVANQAIKRGTPLAWNLIK